VTEDCCIWNVILYNEDKETSRMLDAERKVCKRSVFSPLANWVSWTSAFRPAAGSVRNCWSEISLVTGINKNLYWFFNFQNAPLMRCRHCHFPWGLGENIWEITCTKFHASRVLKYQVGVTTIERPDPKGLFTF
jgi:hypothetical protein